MSENDLIWTAMWLVFITVLCLIFDSGTPLWLLILWLMGF